MNNLTHANLKSLAAQNPKLAISIYLPLHKSGAESRKDSVLFSQLIKKAKDLALEKAYSEEEIETVLKPLRDKAIDIDFWNNLGANAGAFFASENFYTEILSEEHFREEVAVGHRFNIKQLVQMLNANQEYYIFALSKHRNRLIVCNKYDCNEVDVPNLPKDITDALGVEYSNKTLQFQSTGSGSGGKGRGEVGFHGQGSAKDDELDKTKRYINEVDKALYKNFLNDKNAPLIIAGVKEYLPIFQSVSEYKNIVDKAIEGNHDNTSGKELHKLSEKIIQPILSEEATKEFKLYKETRGKDSTDNDLLNIVNLAYQGRIEKLFIHNDFESWGKFDPETGNANVQEEKNIQSEDLAELATFFTVINGGKVYMLDPENYELRNKIAAIARF